jgi:hypothetical protein
MESHTGRDRSASLANPAARLWSRARFAMGQYWRSGEAAAARGRRHRRGDRLGLRDAAAPGLTGLDRVRSQTEDDQRAMLEDLLRRGVAEGGIAPDVTTEDALLQLLGPLILITCGIHDFDATEPPTCMWRAGSWGLWSAYSSGRASSSVEHPDGFAVTEG